ncbi:cytochrome P450 [Mycena floridula]|nr:cytochrome P450 [Mycena floridula]
MHYILWSLLPLALSLYALVDSLRRNAKLQHIPVVGPSGTFSSYVGALRFFFHAREMIQEGYDKAAFRVPRIDQWHIVVSGPKMIEDIRLAGSDELSSNASIDEIVQTPYTMGWEISRNHYHIGMIQTTLTRNILSKYPDMREEMTLAFSDEMTVSADWTKVPALPVIRRIVARIANRMFVGLPLARDNGYLDLNIEFARHVIVGASIINRFPTFLMPVVAQLFTNAPAKVRKGIKYLGPLIQERLDQEEKHGRLWSGRPNDMLSWLLDIAPEDERNVTSMTRRIMSINFAAIHTTSMTFASALYALAARPELAEVLREEAETVIGEYGWTKGAIGKLRKMDSFFLETQRFSGVGIIRKALKDFKFSDGTVVPAGCSVGVAAYPLQFDKEIYPDPEEFKPLRFAESDKLKYRMGTPTLEYLIFGYGKNACPGRFWAVSTTKSMLAHVLLNYDVKTVDGVEPAAQWIGNAVVPNLTADIMFRLRK